MHPVDTTGRDTKIGRDHQRYISSSQGSYRDTIYPTLGQRKHKLVESYPGNYTSRSAHLPAPYMDDHFRVALLPIHLLLLQLLIFL